MHICLYKKWSIFFLRVQQTDTRGSTRDPRAPKNNLQGLSEVTFFLEFIIYQAENYLKSLTIFFAANNWSLITKNKKSPQFKLMATGRHMCQCFKIIVNRGIGKAICQSLCAPRFHIYCVIILLRCHTRSISFSFFPPFLFIFKVAGTTLNHRLIWPKESFWQNQMFLQTRIDFIDEMVNYQLRVWELDAMPAGIILHAVLERRQGDPIFIWFWTLLHSF